MTCRTHEGFDNPIRTAACNGTLEVLELLLKRAEEEIGSTENLPKANHGSVIRLLSTAIDVASYAQSSESAIMLIKFAQKHCGEVASTRRPFWLLKAARNGCTEMINFLLQQEYRSTNSASYQNDLDNIIVEACKHGRTALMRNLLTTERDKASRSLPKSSLHPRYRKHPPMFFAVTFGHRALIDLLHEFGASLDSNCLDDALLFRSAPAFLTVRHLIHAGCVVNRQLAEAVDTRAAVHLERLRDRYGNNRYTTNWVMTVVLIAREIKRFPRDMLPSPSAVSQLMVEVVEGRCKVPTEPLPFRETAKGFLEWVQGGA